MQQRVEETWATPRLMSFLLTAFAALALLLAVVGLYGVMAYNGVRRTREIGVRLALGARRRQISAMMLESGNAIAHDWISDRICRRISALAAHAQFALRHQRGRSADLSRRQHRSVVAAAVACWIPAHRASRVDPMITLRAE